MKYFPNSISVFYFCCSLAGAALPWYYNSQQIGLAEGFTFDGLFAACMANNYSASISSDLLVGSTAVMAWMMIEGYRLKMKGLWLYLLLAFVVAFAFSCPLFLYMRELKLNQNHLD